MYSVSMSISPSLPLFGLWTAFLLVSLDILKWEFIFFKSLTSFKILDSLGARLWL